MNYSNIINSILSDKILSLEEKFILISLKNLETYEGFNNQINKNILNHKKL